MKMFKYPKMYFNTKQFYSKLLKETKSSNETAISIFTEQVERGAMFSHVNETESSQGLRQGRDDGPVTLGIVKQLEEGCSHELVVLRHREVRLLR